MSPRRETVGEAVARRAAADRAARGRGAAGGEPDDSGPVDRGRADRNRGDEERADRDRADRGRADRDRADGRDSRGAAERALGRSSAGRAARPDAGSTLGRRGGAGRGATGRKVSGRGPDEEPAGRRAGGGTDGRGRRRDPAATTDRRGRAASGSGAPRGAAAEPGTGEPADPDRVPGRPAPSPVHRRRRRVALLVGVLVLLAGLGVGVRVLLLDLGLFDVEDVQVTGTLDVAQADVLAAAAVVPGEPLATVDTAGIASRVAQLPGVGAVEVGRGWPHTVTVAVTERTAVAVARTPDGLQPVDSSGVVYPAPVAPGLPQFTFGAVGPEDPSTRAALDVLGALPGDLRAQVLTVDVALGGGTPQVTLGLTEDRQVRWGPAEESARKTGVLVALLTQPGRVYDVTSPALPTVRS